MRIPSAQKIVPQYSLLSLNFYEKIIFFFFSCFIIFLTYSVRDTNVKMWMWRLEKNLQSALVLPLCVCWQLKSDAQIWSQSAFLYLPNLLFLILMSCVAFHHCIKWLQDFQLFLLTYVHKKNLTRDILSCNFYLVLSKV